MQVLSGFNRYYNHPGVESFLLLNHLPALGMVQGLDVDLDSGSGADV